MVIMNTSFQGAFWGMLTGIVIGIIRMSIDFAFPPPACGEIDDRPYITKSVHYLHFAIINALISLFVTIVVSLMSKELEPSMVSNLCCFILNPSSQ